MIFGLNQKIKSFLSSKDVLSVFLVGSLLVASASLNVFRGKEYIINDGLNIKKITTFHREVEKVLELANIKLNENDKLFMNDVSAITTSLNIKRAIPVEVLVDGTEKKINLQEGCKVEEALNKLGVQLGEEDAINLTKDSLISANTKIIVERVETKVNSFEEEIPFTVEKKYDSSVPKGTTKIEKAGVNGKKEITIKEKFINGNLRDDLTQKEEKILAEPVNQVEVIGTKVPPKRADLSFSSNINFSQSEGTFTDHEGKVVKYEKVIKGTTTGYSPDEKGDSGVGSTGVRVRYGHCAVNPRVIPYGTLLYIPGYGYAKAVDTGGAMLRRRNPVLVDLRFNNRNEANTWGRRLKDVFVVKRWSEKFNFLVL